MSSINGSQNSNTYKYASLIERILCFAVDVFLIYTFSFFINLAFMKSVDITWLMLISGLISWLYFPLFWRKFNGKTPGNSICRIKMISMNEDKISSKQLFLRTGFMFVLVCPVGILLLLAVFYIVSTIIMLCRTPHKDTRQTLWDITSKVYVVKNS